MKHAHNPEFVITTYTDPIARRVKAAFDFGSIAIHGDNGQGPLHNPDSDNFVKLVPNPNPNNTGESILMCV